MTNEQQIKYWDTVRLEAAVKVNEPECEVIDLELYRKASAKVIQLFRGDDGMHT